MTMSEITIAVIACTTERVVTRPTPSAPPLTLAPFITPIKPISSPKKDDLMMPCQTSSAFRICSVS